MEEENINQLEQQLISAIHESLENHIPSNAVFLAERLIAEKNSEENKNLLAECYLQEGKPYKAYHVLKNCNSEQNRYKFAIACLKLNKFKDAEKALLQQNVSKLVNLTLKTTETTPNQSYGNYLLGLVYDKQQKYVEAKDQYLKALNLNPTLWIAYEKLCKMGEQVLPNKVFGESKYKLYESNKQIQKQKQVKNIRSDLNEEQISDFDQKLDQKKNFNLKNLNFMNISQFGMNIEEQKPGFQSVAPTKFSIDQKKVDLQQIGNNLSNNQGQGQIKNIATLLKRIAEPFYNMSLYLCQEAIEYFNKLPPNHFNTGWVLTNIGRCYMEMIKYQEAEKFFEESLKVQPYRLEGIEYYSSCLWQLKKSVELCHLAHNALEKSVFAPETWVVVGNCFSMQKEHENALKFFNRAIQLNPNNAYAHTLCGHEYVYNEDFQKAKKCFETALNIDLRSYNAWWGLGNINNKQEKYDRAIEYFQRAIQINPRCSILYSYLGMTMASKRDYMEALKHFENSEKLNPTNVLNKYQKADVLIKLEQYDVALIELEKVRILMPREAPIPTLMGKIYKKLGKIDKAHFYFSQALDLESKDPQKIKSYIETLHNTNNDFNEEFEF